MSGRQIKCPVCAKMADLSPGLAECSRCGADLEPLGLILQAAEWHFQQARERLQNRHWSEAAQHAQASWNLKHSAKAAKAACLAQGALGDRALWALWKRRVDSLSHPTPS